MYGFKRFIRPNKRQKKQGKRAKRKATAIEILIAIFESYRVEFCGVRIREDIHRKIYTKVYGGNP